MSRGFVKEDDQEETPFVPPRADLPAGLSNYVTPAGMNALLQEQEELEQELKDLDVTQDKERRIASNLIHAKQQLLAERIGSAQLIDPLKQSTDQVRFGAYIELLIGNSNEVQEFQIVGVDEADLSKGKMAFNSPIARLLMGKKVGDVALLKLPAGERDFEVVGIKYQ